MAEVALGREVRNLVNVLNEEELRGGRVFEWTILPDQTPPAVDIIRNEWGTFRRKDAERFADWLKANNSNTKFSGEIVIASFGTSLDPSSFIYIEGKLAKAAWGFLSH